MKKIQKIKQILKGLNTDFRLFQTLEDIIYFKWKAEVNKLFAIDLLLIRYKLADILNLSGLCCCNCTILMHRMVLSRVYFVLAHT